MRCCPQRAAPSTSRHRPPRRQSHPPRSRWSDSTSGRGAPQRWSIWTTETRTSSRLGTASFVLAYRRAAHACTCHAKTRMECSGSRGPFVASSSARAANTWSRGTTSSSISAIGASLRSSAIRPWSRSRSPTRPCESTSRRRSSQFARRITVPIALVHTRVASIGERSPRSASAAAIVANGRVQGLFVGYGSAASCSFDASTRSGSCRPKASGAPGSPARPPRRRETAVPTDPRTRPPTVRVSRPDLG